MFRSQPLKIALGDLRHETAGRHSVYMPIGIAYITSYLSSHVDSDDIEVRLYDRPGEILKDIEQWKAGYCGPVQLLLECGTAAVFGEAIIHWSIKKFWHKCEPVTKESSVC